MIIQKVNKKKLIINVAALVLILSIIAYLIFTRVLDLGGGDVKSKKILPVSESPVTIIKKYKNLKAIDDGFFDSETFQDLVEIKVAPREELEIGKENPFVKD